MQQLRLLHFFLKGGIELADMGTREAAEMWGVSQDRVRNYCYRYCRGKNDGLITQDKKGSAYHIPKDFPNPFIKTSINNNQELRSD